MIGRESEIFHVNQKCVPIGIKKPNKQNNMLKASLVLCVFFACVMMCFAKKAPQAPIWPKVWSANFTQTSPGFMVGSWWYDYNAVRQRTDRISGKYDSQHCKSLDTQCVTLVDDKFTWVYWPELKKCCTLCSVSDGCGIIKYDWLKDATFQGYEKKNGYDCNKWFLQGNQKNYFWQTRSSVPYQAFVEMDAVEPGDFMMGFNVPSFNTKPIAPGIFDLPSYCSSATSC